MHHGGYQVQSADGDGAHRQMLLHLGAGEDRVRARNGAQEVRQAVGAQEQVPVQLDVLLDVQVARAEVGLAHDRDRLVERSPVHVERPHGQGALQHQGIEHGRGARQRVLNGPDARAQVAPVQMRLLHRERVLHHQRRKDGGVARDRFGEGQHRGQHVDVSHAERVEHLHGVVHGEVVEGGGRARDSVQSLAHVHRAQLQGPREVHLVLHEEVTEARVLARDGGDRLLNVREAQNEPAVQRRPPRDRQGLLHAHRLQGGGGALDLLQDRLHVLSAQRELALDI